jgi:drug/metabolite transporter (DMT)-like permease
MELTAAVAIIVAAIAPFIVAIFTHPSMKPSLKRGIAGGVAVLLGIVVAGATGKITGLPGDWVAGLTWILVTSAVIISLAEGFYAAWKPAVEKVEKATSLEDGNA